MNSKPLTAVSETELIRKYKNFILREVYIFCVKVGITNNHPAYEDLIVEAQLAFLEACRKRRVSSLDLTAQDHISVKNKIWSCLRVYFWYANNMGGYNNRKIDNDRSYTFTDFQSENNTDFENRAPAYCNIDDSRIDLDAFCGTLPERLRVVIKGIIAGHPDYYIADKLHISPRAVGKLRKVAGNMYLEYLAVT